MPCPSCVRSPLTVRHCGAPQLHVAPNGHQTKTLEQASRCNLEGYGGLDYDTFGNTTAAALRAMPGGRCPYPTGDVPLVKK
mmetsp:Transcript_9616/g.19614  ORF Transcript_9616/g.19614 Transcript_9616/m.19614 type:complete len:81 (-) Transcript_9616:112-354(-)